MTPILTNSLEDEAPVSYPLSMPSRHGVDTYAALDRQNVHTDIACDISPAKRASQKETYDPYPKSPGAMSVKREKWPWKATVIVSVGPLRCFATIRSASPARGLSFS